MLGLAQMIAKGVPVMRLLIAQLNKHVAKKDKHAAQQTIAPLDLSVIIHGGIPVLSLSVCTQAG